MNHTVVRLAAAAFLIVGLGACDSGISPEVVPTGVVANAIQSVHVEPLASKAPDGTPQFLLEVAIQAGIPGVRAPDAINVLGAGPDAPAALIYDDGSRGDRVAGDGVFGGIVSHDCDYSAPEGSSAVASKWGCNFDVVGPGAECGGWGKCPDQAHRSFLWGLIEYDTDVVLCVCVTDCNFEF